MYKIHYIYILIFLVCVVTISRFTPTSFSTHSPVNKMQKAEVIESVGSLERKIWNKIIDTISDPLVPLFTPDVVSVDFDLANKKQNQKNEKLTKNISNKNTDTIINNTHNHYYGLSRAKVESIIDSKLTNDNQIQLQTLENRLRQYVNTAVSHQADSISNSLNRTTIVTTTAPTTQVVSSGGGVFSESVTGLDYSGGVLSLGVGYEIPTTASTSDWTSKVSSQWSGGSGSNIFYTSGNVGIGTSSPAYKLTVNGDISLTGALRASDGSGTAGMVLQTTGSGVQWVATSSLGITGGSPNYLTLGSGYLATATTTDALRAAYFYGSSTATSTLGRLVVGFDQPIIQSEDVGIQVRKKIENTGAPAHGFADFSQYNVPGQAYNSYDALPQIGTSTGTYDHYAAFQARGRINATAVTKYYSFVSNPDILTGNIGSLYHFSSGGVTGSGTITTEYGISIPTMPRATFKISLTSGDPGARLAHAGSGVFGSASYSDASSVQLKSISTTTPQFRTQYDSSNHLSIQTNSTGLTSITAAGTATGIALLGGNVGVGTTTTSSTLTVQGSAGTDAFTIASSTGISLLKLNSAGSLGLGYGASASSLLHLYAASTPVMKFANNITGQLSTDGFDIGLDSSGNAELRQRETLAVTFFTNNVSRMTLDSSGQLGLGVTVPTAKMQIDGGAGSSYLKFTNSSTGAAVGDGIDVGLDGSGNVEFRLRENSEMRFYTNTAQRMVITGGDTVTGGNVGIGTTTPTARLVIRGIGGSSKSFSLTNSTDVEKFVIFADGKTGIRNTNPQAALHVGDSSTNNSSDAQVLISRAVDDTVVGNGHAFSDSSTITRSGTIGYNSYDARITFSGTNNYDHYAGFQAIPTYSSSGLMSNYYGLYSRIDTTAGTITNSYGSYLANPTGAGVVTNNYGLYIESLGKGTTENFAVYTGGTTKSYFGGNVGIGTTTPGQKLVVVGNARITGVTSGAYASDLNLTADGTLTTSASDIRLKENLVAISTSTLDKLAQLKAYSFNWITDPTHRTDIGLIAQDVEGLFPELVFTNKSDGYKGVNYSRLAVLVVEGLQEQQRLIGPYIVDVSAQAIQAIIDEARSEIARNPIVYIGDRASQGVRTLTDLVVVRVTAVRGYFSELFTKEITTEKLCVTKSNGTKVCVDGDQLDSLLNQRPGGALNIQPSQPTPTQTSQELSEGSSVTGPNSESVIGDNTTTNTIDQNSQNTDVAPENVVSAEVSSSDTGDASGGDSSSVSTTE